MGAKFDVFTRFTLGSNKPFVVVVASPISRSESSFGFVFPIPTWAKVLNERIKKRPQILKASPWGVYIFFIKIVLKLKRNYYDKGHNNDMEVVKKMQIF
tara:strand:- start:16424 stop:16720 length:297 start_codon:yes stop_codon:yes gene_type:complete